MRLAVAETEKIPGVVHIVKYNSNIPSSLCAENKTKLNVQHMSDTGITRSKNIKAIMSPPGNAEFS